MNSIMKLFTIILVSVFTFQNAYTQESKPEQTIVKNTFAGTRLITGHSVETKNKGNLDFLIMHRFGTLNSGAYNFFGLDQANIRLALEYAATDNFTFGIGRSSFEKTYDGFVKWKFMQQQSGIRNLPVTMTIFSSMAINTLKSTTTGEEIPFERRLSYSYILLISRKFSNKFSMQLMPAWIHRNFVKADGSTNEVLALGIGGRYKLSEKIGISGEYYPRLTGREAEDYFDALSFGIEFDTGGHVFQLMITNSRPMIEKGFITETTGNWADGDIRFGFNISRVFQIGGSQYGDWE